MFIEQEKLKSIVLGSGLVTEEQWQKIAKSSERRKRPIEDILDEQNLIRYEYLYGLISEHLNIDFINLRKEKLDYELIKEVPEEIVTSIKALPFKKEKGVVHVAMIDPLNKESLDIIRKELNAKIKPHLTTKRSFLFGLRTRQRGLQGELHELLESVLESSAKDKKNKSNKQIPIAELVDTVLMYAVLEKASDIHFEPLPDAMLVRFRVDGELMDKIELPKDIADYIIARIKVLSDLRIDEHRNSQDGRFTFTADEIGVSVRVSIIPSFYGEKAVLRILDEDQQRFNLIDLGLMPHHINQVEIAMKSKQGIILSVGPTGSGKTTTLYTMLNMLNKENINICTIEDPIEYGMRHVNQTQVNNISGYTFINGLRSLLRQDPDVIMIGEIRDKETADIAIHAAMTGHLVFSTVHTNDAVSSLTRLIELGVPGFLLADTINLIASQRLAHRMCQKCMRTVKPSSNVLKELEEKYNLSGMLKRLNNLDLISKKDISSLEFYNASGCENCKGLGFSGRVALLENFTLTEDIRNLIREQSKDNFNINTLEKKLTETEFIFLLEDALLKAVNGVISFDEFLKTLAQHS